MRLGQIAAKSLYVGSSLVGRPTKGILDFYFSQFPDVYDMQRNGDARFVAIAEAIETHVGRVSSLTDVSCFEGYGLAFLARRLGVGDVAALDISEVALERARERLAGVPAVFSQFDLRKLYSHPERGMPTDRRDVVIVAEVLYSLGLQWRYEGLSRSRKKRMIRALQGYAGKAVLFQHFGRDVREAIGSVVRECGGRLVDEEWGIYLLPGANPAPRRDAPAGPGSA